MNYVLRDAFSKSIYQDQKLLHLGPEQIFEETNESEHMFRSTTETRGPF